MKKNLMYGFLAVVTLAMASCSSDESEGNDIPQVEQKSPIGFSVYMPKTHNVRTQEMNTEYLKQTGFGLMAFQTDQAWNNSTGGGLPNFMFNQAVTWKETTKEGTDKWEYYPVKYWPQTSTTERSLSFFGYAPYQYNVNSGMIKVTPGVTGTGGVPEIEYTLPLDNPNKMVDLVAGFYTRKISADHSTVNINFKHTLSRLAFCAKLGADLNDRESAVNITSFKIIKGNQFYSSAKGKFVDTDETLTKNSSASTWAWETPTSGAAKDFDLTRMLNREDPIDFGNYNARGVLVTSTNAVNLFTSDKDYLFLLPANKNTGADGSSGLQDGQSIQFEISYDVVTRDSKMANGHTKVSYSKTITLKGEGSSTGTVDEAKRQLQQGVAYKYTLTIGLNALEVSGKVEDWAGSVVEYEGTLSSDAIDIRNTVSKE